MSLKKKEMLADVEHNGDVSIESGGSLDIESGASFKIGGAAVTATAAELNLADGADRVTKIGRVALAAVDTAGGIFTWANPTGAAIVVTRLVLNITTKTAGASTLDCGTTDTSATTLSDNLIDGLDANAAAGVFDNLVNHGTSGKAGQPLAAGKWVTGSLASGASAGLVGYAYIHYHAA